MTDGRKGEAALLAANETFYRAFAARDIAAMERLWSDAAFAACIHPGWNALRGRELVLASWRSILGSAQAPRVVCANPTAHVLGEAGFVVCEERVGAAVLIATNVFMKDGAAWRMVHHHAAPVAQDAFVVVPGDQDGEPSPLN